MNHIEPVLDADDIQADIAPGFRLPFQRLVTLRAGLNAAQAVLSMLRPGITLMREAAEYHRRRVSAAKKLRTFSVHSFAVAAPAHLRWVNVALGPRVLEAAGLRAPLAVDRSFALGLAARSTTLGDPQDSSAPGHRSHWVVGGPQNTGDVLVILGSDDRETLAQFADDVQVECIRLGASVIHTAAGERLPGDIEHFGFRDGISQPAMRGRLTPDPEDFIARRKFPPAPHGAGPELAAPGDVLVWPGEFLFGYPRQDAHDFREPLAEEPIDDSLRNGSFLVFRRLAQDVSAFRAATSAMADTLRASPEFSTVTQEWIEARLVGRWRSGAPLVRNPTADPGEPPGTLDRFNHFAFNEATPAVTLPSGERISEAPPDRAGDLCPMHAHIRKVNPRDLGSNQGPASQTQKLRILRRGIPYGPPFIPDAPDDNDRGLLFVSFQRSIRNQFELLSRDWMNSDTNPEGPQGHDMIAGQPGGRDRFCIFRFGSGAVRVTSGMQWITPTGGGYFFCPSLTTIGRFIEAPGDILRRIVTPVHDQI
jgi:Dyp-type peroxidase family